MRSEAMAAVATEGSATAAEAMAAAAMVERSDAIALFVVNGCYDSRSIRSGFALLSKR